MYKYRSNEALIKFCKKNEKALHYIYFDILFNCTSKTYEQFCEFAFKNSF